MPMKKKIPSLASTACGECRKERVCRRQTGANRFFGLRRLAENPVCFGCCRRVPVFQNVRGALSGDGFCGSSPREPISAGRSADLIFSPASCRMRGCFFDASANPPLRAVSSIVRSAQPMLTRFLRFAQDSRIKCETSVKTIRATLLAYAAIQTRMHQ